MSSRNRSEDVKRIQNQTLDEHANLTFKILIPPLPLHEETPEAEPVTDHS